MRLHPMAVAGAMWAAQLMAGRVSAQTFVVEAHLPTAQAHSVDITADGTRAVVCGGLSGPLQIFARTGTAWAQEGLLSSPTDAVSISDDGALAVGISGGGVSGPSMTVLRRVGTTWTPTVVPHRRWYHSVALSGDGSRMLACSTVYGDCDVYVVSATSVLLETTLRPPRAASGSFDIVTTYDGSRFGWVDFRGTEVFARRGTTWTFEYLAPVAGSVTDSSASMTSDGALLVQWDDGMRASTTFARTAATWMVGPVVTSSRQQLGDDTASSGNGARLYTHGADSLGQPHTWMFRLSAGSYAMAAETDEVGDPIATTELGDRLIGEDSYGSGGTVIMRIALLAGEPCASAGDCASGVCAGGCCDGACPAPPDAGVAADAGPDAGGVDASIDASADVDAGAGIDASTAIDASAAIDAQMVLDSSVLLDDGAVGDAASATDAGARTDADGSDAATRADGAFARDGGETSTAGVAGCGCRTAAGGARRSALAALAMVTALGWRRRRRLAVRGRDEHDEPAEQREPVGTMRRHQSTSGTQ